MTSKQNLITCAVIFVAGLALLALGAAGYQIIVHYKLPWWLLIVIVMFILIYLFKRLLDKATGTED